MKKLNLTQFNDMLELSILKPKLKRDLKFAVSTLFMSDEDWDTLELLSIKDKSGNKGVLIVEIASGTYLLPHELKKLTASSTTGRPSAIMCDVCMTWQSGARAGSISFTHIKNSTTNVGFLCCEDLLCSMHVRTLTSSSKISRAQLREDMDDAKRVTRLNERLERLMVSLGAVPITRL
jgi:hypothetical protein